MRSLSHGLASTCFSIRSSDFRLVRCVPQRDLTHSITVAIAFPTHLLYLNIPQASCLKHSHDVYILNALSPNVLPILKVIQSNLGQDTGSCLQCKFRPFALHPTYKNTKEDYLDWLQIA